MSSRNNVESITGNGNVVMLFW